MENGSWRAGLRYGLFGYVVRLWNIVLHCEILMWTCAILWCILFSYLDFHNAKQSGILHSVGWKLKNASKKSVRNFSFVRIEYLRTNRGIIQNMRFLAKVGYWWKLSRIAYYLLAFGRNLMNLIVLFPTHYAVYSVIDCHRSSYRLERYSYAES